MDNGTVRMLKPGILGALETLASTTPAAVAVAAAGRRSLTFAALQEQIDAVSRSLQHFRERVVAVALPGGPEFITAVLGVLDGAACAPLNPALAESELQAFLSELRASAIIVPRGAASPAHAAARALDIAILELSRDASDPAGVFELEHPPGALGGATPAETAASLLLHTSATTGKPKLVPLTAANLDAMCAHSRAALHLGARDRLLSLMPLFHLQGLISVLAQMAAGGAAICARGFDASKIAEWFSEHRPTWYTAGPALHRAIIEAIATGPHPPCPSLRFVRSIGAAMPPDLLAAVERVVGVPVLEGYGLTEAGLVTSNPLPPAIRKPGSAGRSAGPEVAIADAAGRILPPGAEGEIIVRGPSVMAGYRGDSEANKEAFHGRWLRTGDLARLDEDGYLYVTGRIKEMINRGGEKIAPADVDAALVTHPAVAEAAAFGVTHPRLGEDVAAAVVLRPGASATESELRAWAAARLAAFKVPRRIAIVDAIPKSATGKSRRGVLSATVVIPAGESEDAAATAPAPGPIVARLAVLWGRLLNRPRVGSDDDWFHLGGDSLGAAVMLEAVRREFGAGERLLGRVDFFERPTISTLARIVAECDSDEHSETPNVIRFRGGSHAPLVFIPPASSDPYYFRHLAAGLRADQPVYMLRTELRVPESGAPTVEHAAEDAARDIAKALPRGDYILAGHCFGGIIAFETARRLASQGARVRLVVLFDTPAPGYPKVVRSWRRYLGGAARITAALRKGEASGAIRAAADHARFLYGIAKRRAAARARRILGGGGSQVTTILSAPPEDNEAVARSYQPRPLGIPVVQIFAAGVRTSTEILDDPRLGWQDFATAGFTSISVPGDHSTMLDATHAPRVAAELQRVLDKAQQS